jgi:excisionase family DNA binding protein
MAQKRMTPPDHKQTVENLQFFSVAEVAAILGVSRKLVASWIHEGRLPVFRLGSTHRVMRIRRQDLDTFIANNIRNKPTQPAVISPVP